mgnify:CR=1 FL=1
MLGETLLEVGSSLLGGLFGSKSEKKQTEMEIKGKKELVGLTGLEERRNLEYQAQLSDYYDQLNKQRKAKGFADSAKYFGGSGELSPTYQQNLSKPGVGGLTSITGVIPGQAPVPQGGFTRAI